MNRTLERVEQRVLTVSAVFALIDAYTGKPVSGSNGKVVSDCESDPSRRQYRAVRNPSGFHVFTELPRGEYTVRASVPGFLPGQAKLKVPVSNRRKPTQIVLRPDPTYPFPADATLVRGVVRANGECVGVKDASLHATLHVKHNGQEDTEEIESKTAGGGDFVLWFHPQRLAKGAKIGELTVDVGISHPDAGAGQIVGRRIAPNSVNSVGVCEISEQ